MEGNYWLPPKVDLLSQAPNVALFDRHLGWDVGVIPGILHDVIIHHTLTYDIAYTNGVGLTEQCGTFIK